MATAFTGMLAGTLGIDAEDLGKAIDRLTKARDRKAAAEATGDRKAAEAEGQADDGSQADKASSGKHRGPAESVFVRVPHGTPDDDHEEVPA